MFFSLFVTAPSKQNRNCTLNSPSFTIFRIIKYKAYRLYLQSLFLNDLICRVYKVLKEPWQQGVRTLVAFIVHPLLIFLGTAGISGNLSPPNIDLMNVPESNGSSRSVGRVSEKAPWNNIYQWDGPLMKIILKLYIYKIYFIYEHMRSYHKTVCSVARTCFFACDFLQKLK